ncbi:class I SAM-dependent methyltransferase [Asanoa sp. WMMD1127]|uniref:class I SAM-dependent methyltransferase n=1 Tax=Asanoa sp. WMMD1127 TaxID=3016107 RepID=UPI0024159D31|nr:class I SAM-dependent methyltransferase [Asanoa sp. WMMD1127]MDG4823267.1 class I SAM-dependent methyltransferase [Asanoa sp. WMMD1127]
MTDSQIAVEDFVGRVLTDFAGATTTAATVLGDRAGLYKAMAGLGWTTADKLAATTGLNPRLVREWLAVQVVSGYVTYDAATGAYELPVEHAMVLAVEDSPAYIIGAADIIAGEFEMLSRLEAALRSDGGVAYRDYPSTVHTGIERFFRTAYVHQLAQVWFPSVPGLVSRLEAGARVADFGCGHGVATLLMASLWPASTFDGFDSHEASVVTARARAVEAGSPSNVAFHVAAGDAVTDGPYDVVVFFDALHDMGDPPAVLRRAYDVLAPGGVVVAVEPWSVDNLADGIGNPIVRLNYAASTLLCTPNSLSQPGAYGLGTAGGPTHRVQLLADAGFRDAAVVADTGHNLVVAGVR